MTSDLDISHNGSPTSLTIKGQSHRSKLMVKLWMHAKM